MHRSKTKRRPAKKIHCSSAEATIWTACAFLPCLWSEATFWNPLPHMGQPIVMSKCFLIWVNIQSLFVWWNVHSWHLYSLPPPGWLIHSGWAYAGIASSGTVTVGRKVDLPDGHGQRGLLGLEATSGWGISVGVIWHFDGISREVNVVASLPLGDATAKEESVMPTIGIVEGGGAIRVMVYARGGWIICLCEVDAVTLGASRSMS